MTSLFNAALIFKGSMISLAIFSAAVLVSSPDYEHTLLAQLVLLKNRKVARCFPLLSKAVAHQANVRDPT